MSKRKAIDFQLVTGEAEPKQIKLNYDTSLVRVVTDFTIHTKLMPIEDRVEDMLWQTPEGELKIWRNLKWLKVCKFCKICVPDKFIDGMCATCHKWNSEESKKRRSQPVSSVVIPKQQRTSGMLWKNPKGEIRIWRGRQWMRACPSCLSAGLQNKQQEICAGCLKFAGILRLGKIDKTPVIERKDEPDNLQASSITEIQKQVPVQQRKNGMLWLNKKGELKIWLQTTYKPACVECKQKSAHYGIWDVHGDGKRLWCHSCAVANHNHEFISFQIKCDDCKEKSAVYGTIREDGRQWRRWCLACAMKNHASEYIDFRKKCQHCKTKCMTYGTINNKGKREFKWCATCANAYYADICVSFVKKCSTAGCDKCAHTDGFCVAHHPDYVATMSGTSKAACDFMDRLSQELGISIQHIHFDVETQQITGEEYKIADTKYKVDGFIQGSLSNSPFPKSEKGLFIEFHGHEYHGFPDGKKADEFNRFGYTYGELYRKTMARMTEIKERAGMPVVYIWESSFNEYKKRMNSSSANSLVSYCLIA